MKKTGKYLISFWAICLVAFSMGAQDVIFYATVSKNPVGLGERFTLNIVLENAQGNIEPPDFSQFVLVGGPTQSSSYRFVNGQQSSTFTLSYVLRPRDEGKFTIGPAKVAVGSKTYTTRAIDVEVVKGAANQQSPQSRPGVQQVPQQQAQRTDGVMLRILVSKNSAYLGEAISVQYALLSRHLNIDLGETDFPSFTGFWSEEIKLGQINWEPQTEMIDGIPYRKAILRKYVVFPQRTGELTIEAASLTCRVNRSIINPGTEVKARSNSPVISVKPLPSGAPASFNGAVGDFQFSVKAERLEVDANDAIDLAMTLSGKGNTTLIKAPAVKFPDDFDMYDPEVKDRLSVTPTGVSGSRTYQYLIIPRYPGDYEIDVVEFSWFNPATGKYNTKTEGPFKIKVKGDAALHSEAGAARARSVVKQSKDEIRYIMLDAAELNPRRRSFYGSASYYTVIALPYLLFGAFMLLRKRRQALLADVVGSRKRVAGKNVRKRLKAAESAMKSGDSKLFYAEIFTAVYGYLGDKLGVNKAQLTKQSVQSMLKDHGVKEGLAQEVLYIIETCELARFSPITEQTDNAFYERTRDIIEKLDEKIK